MSAALCVGLMALCTSVWWWGYTAGKRVQAERYYRGLSIIERHLKEQARLKDMLKEARP